MQEVLEGKVEVLKVEARRRGLEETGNKPDIRNRIVADMLSKGEDVPKQFIPPAYLDSVRGGENAGGLTAKELQDQEAAPANCGRVGSRGGHRAGGNHPQGSGA